MDWYTKQGAAAAVCAEPNVTSSRRGGGSGARPVPAEAGMPWRRTRLETLLDRSAERIVEGGTCSEVPTLCAMSTAATHLSPAAAAAPVDWNGSEVARLRAFGIVHGAILRDLSARERSRLRAHLTSEVHHERPHVPRTWSPVPGRLCRGGCAVPSISRSHRNSRLSGANMQTPRPRPGAS